MSSIRRFVLLASMLTSLSVIDDAAAQPFGAGMRGWGSDRDRKGSGMMMGLGMMKHERFDAMCSPAAAGFVGWRIDRLESLIKPTDAQRGKFEELRAASSKASEAMRVACPTDVPATVTGRMEAMEKRLDAMLQAVKTIRAPLEAFYATLSDEQKARLDAPPGRMRFWRELW